MIEIDELQTRGEWRQDWFEAAVVAARSAHEHGGTLVARQDVRARSAAHPSAMVPRPDDVAARVPAEAGWLRTVFSGPDAEEVELRGPGATP